MLLSPFNSLLVVSAFAAWPFVLAGWAWRRRGRLRAQAIAARAEFEAPRSLAPGLSVVAGVVEFAPGEEMAVQVEHRQGRLMVPGEDGLVAKDYREAWLKWMRPFYICCTDGQRVLVRPTPQTLLIDEVEVFRSGESWAEDGTRIKAERHVAWLAPGERLVALGQVSRLVGTDGGSTWVLDAPRGGAMKLATRPAEEQGLQTRVRASEVSVALCLSAFPVLVVVALWPFYVALFSGARPEISSAAAGVGLIAMLIAGTAVHLSGLRSTPWWESKGARTATVVQSSRRDS